MQRELTADESAELLSRNFDVNAKVVQHRRIVEAGQWDQVMMNESVFFKLPIPAKGLIFSDAQFGVLVIFPDAAGALHFSADAAADLLASDITKPPFQSPSGNTLTQFLTDLQKGFAGIVTGLLLIGLVYLAIEIER